MYERAVSGSECPFPEPFFENEAVDKEVDSPQRKGRVCAGNPRKVSCTIEILSFQNFYEVLKTCSAGRKDFFDTLENILCRIDVAVVERPAFRALSEPNTEVFGLLVAVTTATASLTGREEPVNDDEFLSIPVGFAGKLSADFTPRGISDMECELVAPHHVLPRLRVLDKG